tara:strand:+ start:4936 stop:5277 length:342 start_codon:yes stop_codon:yes gene_type:complete
MKIMDKKYGPTVAGKIWANDYKTSDKHPDYKTSGKYHVQADESFIKGLVEALRGQGTDARIGISVWENEEKDGGKSLYVKLEAVAITPEEVQEAPPPQPAPAPLIESFDDIPF